MIRNEKDRQLLARLPGMTVALATPLDDNGSFDREAFRGLIDHVLGEGAAATFALGWMGEQPALLKYSNVWGRVLRGESSE